MKRVLILATGGTIAGSAKDATSSQYTAGKMGVDELIKSVSGLEKLAKISFEQISNIGSQDMDVATLGEIKRRIYKAHESGEFDGVVVLHGTDTMEESAFYLTLSLDISTPVILTGAMRNSSSLSSDGALNIYDAVGVAISEQAKNSGVLVVLNSQIHAASYVTKLDCANVAAFDSPNLGQIGVVNYGDAKFYTKPAVPNRGKFKSADKVEKVGIITAGVDLLDGLGEEMVRFMLSSGVRGIVLEGVGNGNASAKLLQELEKAALSGVVIVRASRCVKGEVREQAEIVNDKFIASYGLNPAKSRLLLALGLGAGFDFNEIKALFSQY
ncbi:asparaginase [Campylobacter sp. 19-13652]|uniref:asparaginase n=1 Tax=Campylobacter sp. 19-13652 TaxID=2840180 RepID=UPI001C78FD57|nr:asparaginase [Campylobacter sp. 19-13652]BCX79348.1 putative L-asparaginase [Campylobacter sp. 19-13652]